MNRPVPHTLLTIIGIHSRTKRVRANGKLDYSYVYKAVCLCGKETTVPDRRTYGKKLKISCGLHTRAELNVMPRHPTKRISFTRPSIDKVREMKDYGGSATKHPLYSTWSNMIDRCENEKSQAYKHYGGRGIYVDEFWRNSFWAFAATAGERFAGGSLGRIDNDGPYSPENCRWETSEEQAQNRRTAKLITYNGVTKSVPDWAREFNTTSVKINSALSLGIPGQVILHWMARRLTP